MIAALVVVGVVELVAITVLVLLAAAPMGWEDEQGFHYGFEPGTDQRGALS